jgi:hypothetical protein
MNGLQEQATCSGMSLNRHETARRGLGCRIRVIYADLSEFVGTTAEWDQVRDGILIALIENRPGYWVSLYGDDRYCVYGDRLYSYTGHDYSCAGHDPCDIAADSAMVPPLRLNRNERSGKLVANDVWQRAKAKMHELPDGL